MKYETERAKNGWVLIAKEEDGDSYIVGQEAEDEVESFAFFLRDINENLGPSTGRHDRKRIQVITIPGDKFSGKLTQEEIEELRYLKERIEAVLEDQAQGNL